MIPMGLGASPWTTNGLRYATVSLMHAGIHDEHELFAAIERSGARAILIGRRALVAYGLPVLTADYDLWLHFDDVEALNDALDVLDMAPNRSPQEARRTGRYVIENGDHIDVMVARSKATLDGEEVLFDDVFARSMRLPLGEDVTVCVPALDDLIRTKRWSARDKDIADLRLLEALKGGRK